MTWRTTWGIGIPTHFLLTQYRSPVAACGTYGTIHYSTNDHKLVSCKSCRRTNAFRNHLKEIANAHT